MSFVPGIPATNTLLNVSNAFITANSTAGTALTVQQLGSGALMNVATTSGSSAVFVNSSGQVGVVTNGPTYTLDVQNTMSSTTTSMLSLTNPYIFAFNTGLNIGSGISFLSRWQGDGLSGVVEMCKIDGRKEQNANYGRLIPSIFHSL
jgi:hypothetical protein